MNIDQILLTEKGFVRKSDGTPVEVKGGVRLDLRSLVNLSDKDSLNRLIACIRKETEDYPDEIIVELEYGIASWHKLEDMNGYIIHGVSPLRRDEFLKVLTGKQPFNGMVSVEIFYSAVKYVPTEQPVSSTKEAVVIHVGSC